MWWVRENEPQKLMHMSKGARSEAKSICEHQVKLLLMDFDALHRSYIFSLVSHFLSYSLSLSPTTSPALINIHLRNFVRKCMYTVGERNRAFEPKALLCSKSEREKESESECMCS